MAAFVVQSLLLTPAGLGIHEAAIRGVLLLFSVPSSIGMAIALFDRFARGLVIFVFLSLRPFILPLRNDGNFKDE